MSATATPSAIDRTELPNLLISGVKLGVTTAVLVALFLAVSRNLSGMAAEVVEVALVLGVGLCMALLPAQWTSARHTEGIAGAAGIGLFSTIVFMAIDVLVFRPIKAYPWTWDAIGGNSTWWYLPVWWQLGTFVSWMGAMLTAGRSVKAPATVVSLAIPLVVVAVVVGLGAHAMGFGFTRLLPVAVGFGFAVTLTVFGVTAIVRKG
jgi:hypothetical protein